MKTLVLFADMLTMKNIFAKFIVFGMFVFLIVFLVQQNKNNTEQLQVKKVSGGLGASLDSAKNELILVLGQDSTLKQSIKDLKLSYKGCGFNLSILPDFIYNAKTSSIQVCNVSLLNKTADFHQRIVYEFITQKGLCINPPNQILTRLCEDRDQNEKYVVNRVLASHDKSAKNLLTLNMDYGDKSSVFMVLTGNQNKMAYKTNYGDERIVQLQAEDITYLTAQLSKIKRKFSKPKCQRKVIRLYAQNALGQRFRSYSCIEDLSENTQAILKLTRTVSSLSQTTF